MVGLLLPLVMAAVLSVVAVKAAGRQPAPLSPAALARSRPAAGGRTVSGRRLAGAGMAAAAVVGLLALAGQGQLHGGGDPGGRILADLRLAASAVPDGARVLARDEREPRWVTCDGAPGSGWTDVGLTVHFAVPLAGSQLIEGMGARLVRRGWRLDQASGTAATWSKPLATGRDALLVLTRDGDGTWWARLSAASEGAGSAEDC